LKSAHWHPPITNSGGGGVFILIRKPYPLHAPPLSENGPFTSPVT
jgi:hypothetical protein